MAVKPAVWAATVKLVGELHAGDGGVGVGGVDQPRLEIDDARRDRSMVWPVPPGLVAIVGPVMSPHQLQVASSDARVAAGVHLEGASTGRCSRRPS